jgi:putative ABC transport system substrate-binding protein
LAIDFRWGTGDDAWISSTVKDLLVFSPSVVVANSFSVARAVQLASKPVVFIGPNDLVAQGLVQSFAHPGGNLTGFTVLEPSIGPNGSNCSRKLRA